MCESVVHDWFDLIVCSAVLIIKIISPAVPKSVSVHRCYECSSLMSLYSNSLVVTVLPTTTNFCHHNESSLVVCIHVRFCMPVSFLGTTVHIFSERELKFMFAICHRRSVVCRLSVTLVHPTQAIEIFANVSTP